MEDVTKKRIAYAIVSLAALATLLVFPNPIARIAAEQPGTEIKTPFDNLVLEAKAVFVYDTATQKALFMKNAYAPMPLASLTKIMTAYTAADLAPLSTTVTVDSNALQEEGDSGLYGNEKWSLSGLLKYTLVVSSNDGAAAVAAALGSQSSESTTASRSEFVQKMNEKAKLLGLNSMIFNNESGLDITASLAGAYGSAKDTARLFASAVTSHPDIFAPTRKPSVTITSESDIAHTATNTNILASRIPSFIAGKTGFSDLAGGNLAVAFNAKPNHPIIIIVLGSTYDGRFTDVNKIIQASLKSVSTSTAAIGAS